MMKVAVNDKGSGEWWRVVVNDKGSGEWWRVVVNDEGLTCLIQWHQGSKFQMNEQAIGEFNNN